MKSIAPYGIFLIKHSMWQINTDTVNKISRVVYFKKRKKRVAYDDNNNNAMIVKKLNKRTATETIRKKKYYFNSIRMQLSVNVMRHWDKCQHNALNKSVICRWARNEMENFVVKRLCRIGNGICAMCLYLLFHFLWFDVLLSISIGENKINRQNNV